MTKDIFKTCPMCGQTWRTRDDFLDDADLRFNGYQANFSAMEHGLFYFTHEIPPCGSTMIISAEAFLSLYSGPRYTQQLYKNRECAELCNDRTQLGRCLNHCEYAFVREVSQIIKDRSRQNTANETGGSARHTS